MGVRLGDVEDSISTLKNDFRTLEGRLVDVESRLDARVDHSQNAAGQAALESSQLATFHQRSRREESYWRARRSLRIWPLVSDGPGMRQELPQFVQNKLKMDVSELPELDDCTYRKVPKTRSSSISGEVIVEFPLLTCETLSAVRPSTWQATRRQEFV